MLLYLVRHGHAVTEEQDATRPLSARGMECTRRLADFFKQNGAFAPVQLWHSPLRRSRETAEILIRELALDCGMIETSDLLPEDAPEETAARLAAMTGIEALAVVGHEPHLSALATLLVRGKTRPAAFELKKGAVVALERTDELHKKSGEPRWVAVWHFPPALLPLRPLPPASPTKAGGAPQKSSSAR